MIIFQVSGAVPPLAPPLGTSLLRDNKMEENENREVDLCSFKKNEFLEVSLSVYLLWLVPFLHFLYTNHLQVCFDVQTLLALTSFGLLAALPCFFQLPFVGTT